nr:unnamed protein product [Fasciola hepatica]
MEACKEKLNRERPNTNAVFIFDNASVRSSATDAPLCNRHAANYQPPYSSFPNPIRVLFRTANQASVECTLGEDSADASTAKDDTISNAEGDSQQSGTGSGVSDWEADDEYDDVPEVTEVSESFSRHEDNDPNQKDARIQVEADVEATGKSPEPGTHTSEVEPITYEPHFVLVNTTNILQNKEPTSKNLSRRCTTEATEGNMGDTKPSQMMTMMSRTRKPVPNRSWLVALSYRILTSV